MFLFQLVTKTNLRDLYEKVMFLFISNINIGITRINLACGMQALQLTHHFIVFSALNIRANMANIMTDWRRKKLHYGCLLFCPLRSTSPCVSVLIFQAEI